MNTEIRLSEGDLLDYEEDIDFQSAALLNNSHVNDIPTYCLPTPLSLNYDMFFPPHKPLPRVAASPSALSKSIFVMDGCGEDIPPSVELRFGGCQYMLFDGTFSEDSLLTEKELEMLYCKPMSEGFISRYKSLLKIHMDVKLRFPELENLTFHEDHDVTEEYSLEILQALQDHLSGTPASLIVELEVEKGNTASHLVSLIERARQMQCQTI